jgi:transcriptional regulator with XRE-family HTH domain
MESNELRFRHIGLSTDGAVIFCSMDNGRTYELPLSALRRAEDWHSKARPESAGIMHDGYAAFVEFGTGVKVDFPSDFVLHVCEPSYGYHKTKTRAASGVGARIREIRKARGLTLDALAAKCGIAKPNLSRLENDKVTPTFETLTTIAVALETHPTLLISAKKPEHAFAWTEYQFVEWKRGLLWNEEVQDSRAVCVGASEMVSVFLATRPEHRYARSKLLAYANPNGTGLGGYPLDAEKWDDAVAIAKGIKDRAKSQRGHSVQTNHVLKSGR